jgi:hypothetical protein
MPRKQSQEDQTKRINDFCCPIHGVIFTQEILRMEGVKFSLAKCSRKDCDIMAIVDFGEGNMGDFRIRQLVTREQLNKLQQMWESKFHTFAVEVGVLVDLELKKMSHSPEVQLPVSG